MFLGHCGERAGQLRLDGFGQAVYDDFVSQERTALPLDAFFTGSSDYHAINQTLFTDGDVDAYLKALQANWEANGVKE